MIDQREIDKKIDQETKKINFFDWVVSMLAVGMLWAIYEKRNLPAAASLAALAALPRIGEDQVYGRRKVSGALAKIEHIEDVLPFGRQQREILDLSLANAGVYLKQISEKAKSDISNVLIDSQVSGMTPKQIETRLREAFKGIDRDWRKVAVTESATTAVNGYLLTQGVGQQIVIQSAVDCCEWCRSMLHGKVFTVLHEAPSDPKDWDTSLWPGKNNIGRSRHKNARGGQARAAGQLWTPCCPLHPSCRCRPTLYDPRFQEIGDDGYLRLKKVWSKP